MSGVLAPSDRVTANPVSESKFRQVDRSGVAADGDNAPDQVLVSTCTLQPISVSTILLI